MSRKTLTLDDRLHDYLLGVSLREPEVMRRLRKETAAHPEANMQIAPEQGQFMALLVRMLGARRTLEIGVFTGYSALAVALALPAGGTVVACDVSEASTSVARRYWAEAGVAGRIDLRIAPAADTLDALIAGGESGTFDFVFIDADKENYDRYYEQALALVRPGGLIAIDNVLWSGEVADPSKRGPELDAIRLLNAKLVADERVELSVVPIADGLTLALRKGGGQPS